MTRTFPRAATAARFVAAWTALATVACGPETVEYTPMASVPSPVTNLDGVLFLVGDAGADTPGRDSVFSALGRDLAKLSETDPEVPILVAFLGDNIYDAGARADHRAVDLAQLSAQVDALGPAPDARAVFLPGNHDWAVGAETSRGREAILRQQAWLDEISDGRDIGFLPPDGCPGPAAVSLVDGVTVLFLDTEWLLRRPEGFCGGIDAFYDRLRDELAARAGERVIIATHHPMASGGGHAGNVGWLDKGPFVYYLGVKAGLSGQDLASGRYAEMLDRLNRAIEGSGTTPLAIVSGHEHSLQVIRMTDPGAPAFQLISGSGSKLDPVKRIGGTRFASGLYGYMRLDFARRSTRVVVVGQPGPDQALGPLFTCVLSEAAASGRTGVPGAWAFDACPEATLAGTGP